MTVAVRYLASDEAVAEGLAMAQEGTPIREAAWALVSEGLTPEALRTFAARGLGAVIQERIYAANGSWAESEPRREDELSLGQPAARGRSSTVGRHHARDLWERVLRANYEGADGVRKTVLAFTLADAQALLTLARSRAIGYAKLADAMELAAGLLAKHKADTVADLPLKAKQAIAEAVA